jgi:outer membrane receptor for ferrienterochelin and colicin
VGSNFKASNITENTYDEDIFRYYSGIEDISGKIDFDYFPSPRHSVKFGTSYTYHHFTPGAKRIQIESVVLSDSSGIDKDFNNLDIYAHDFAAYIEDDITITENLKMNAGLHLSVFNVQNETFIRPQPRISLRYKALDNWALKASYTRMAQHVHLLTSSGISMPTDLWLPVTKKFAPPISDQYVLGTAINLNHGINITAEGFYKNMTNLIEYKEGASFMGNNTNWEDKVEKGIGWSYGAEIMIEKTVGKTTGWIGYTWSKTERQFDNLNFGRPFPAKYDRRHDISIAFTHQINEKIDISGTWVYGTGNAVTLAIMEFPSMEIPYTDSWFANENLKDYGGRNNYRMPAYHRLDLGINLHKKKKNGIRTWSFSIYNAYNNLNPFLLEWNMKQGDYIYNSVTGEVVLEGDPEMILQKLSIFPFIPSISYSFKF